MHKVKLEASPFKGLAILALCLFPFFLQANPLTNTLPTSVLKNDLLKIEAVELIETMGQELQSKTGVHAYAIASNEHFPEHFNLVTYSKQYEANMTKPYVLFIFAPYATITKKSGAQGRVGIIPSSELVRKMYDYDDVRDAAVNIVAIKDSNTDEDKFNVAVLQGYSVLADNIAASKGLKLETTIPNEIGMMVNILRFLVYSGTIILLWIFFLRPLWMRRKNGKQ